MGMCLKSYRRCQTNQSTVALQVLHTGDHGASETTKRVDGKVVRLTVTTKLSMATRVRLASARIGLSRVRRIFTKTSAGNAAPCASIIKSGSRKRRPSTSKKWWRYFVRCGACCMEMELYGSTSGTVTLVHGAHNQEAILSARRHRGWKVLGRGVLKRTRWG